MMLRFRRWPGRPSPIYKHVWSIKALICEFIGSVLVNILTFTYIFDTTSYLLVAICYGFIVSSLMFGFIPLSGGHLNPAITLSFWVIGRITSYIAVAYILVQCIGAIVGSFILDSLIKEPPMPSTPPSQTWPTFSTTSTSTTTTITGTIFIYITPTPDEAGKNPNPIIPTYGTTVLQAFIVEFIAAMVLLMAVCSGTRAGLPGTDPVVPVAVLLAATVGHLFAAGFTGAGLNPARVLGNARRFNRTHNHYVILYVGATCLGGIVGACISRDVIHPSIYPRPGDWAGD